MVFINLWIRDADEWQFINISVIEAIVIIDPQYLSTSELELDIKVKFISDNWFEARAKRGHLRMLGVWVEK